MSSVLTRRLAPSDSGREAKLLRSAAFHSYVLSQRFLLRDSGVQALEMAPPWVRTELMNSQDAAQAMPLDRFIAETLDVFGTDANEILVEAAKPLRANPGPEEHALVGVWSRRPKALA
jgi:uncharacterized oxidoreductase